MQPVVIGIQDFAKFKERNAFYIDKTSFIKEWWEQGDDVTILLRPRRFGKTLLLDTVNKFFSLEYKEQADLFDGLSIMQDKKIASMQGTRPVISLTFADVKARTMEIAMELIKAKIWDLFRRYRQILDFSKLTEEEQSKYKQYNQEMTTSTACGSLQFLSSLLESCYGEKVLLLLDEYDSPLIEAYTNGYWEEMVDFMRLFFNSSFKTNPSRERVLMTGINRISQQSLFSDFNNAKIYGIRNNRYTTCCGFTQEEVDNALKQYNLYDQREVVKAHYDGFIIGKEHGIYNPWSITNYLQSGELENYWVNTASNSLISTLLFAGNKKLKLQFEDLLNDIPIKIQIEDNLDFTNLAKTTNAIWSLLYAAGYLKAEAIDYANNIYAVTITNGETKNMFNSLVVKWFDTSDDLYQDFCEALLKHNLREMNKYFNELTLEIVSYHDMAKKPENFYHGLVLGLMVDLRGKYKITSNRESGYGRYDLVLEARDKSKGIIIEFKTLDEEEGEAKLEDTAERALEQIESKCYASELVANGIANENIYKYGFAFQGKKVLIARG